MSFQRGSGAAEPQGTYCQLPAPFLTSQDVAVQGIIGAEIVAVESLGHAAGPEGGGVIGAGALEEGPAAGQGDRRFEFRHPLLQSVRRL